MNWCFIKDRDYVSYGTKYNLPDYNIINLNVRYLLNKNLSFAFAADNLTNENYVIESGYPMPERCYTLSSKYTF